MGTKAEINTIEGMRRAAHAAIDDFFNRLPTKEDGTPVDEVRLHSESNHEVVGLCTLSTGRMFGVMANYDRPMLTSDADVIVHTSDGLFKLSNKEGLNALVRFLSDENGLGYAEAAEAIGSGGERALVSGMGINELARRTRLLFEPVPKAVVSAPTPEAPTPEAPTSEKTEGDKGSDVEGASPDAAVAEAVKEALASEIAGLRSKAEAKALAEKHKVILTDDMKFAEMKTMLHDVLIDEKVATSESAKSDDDTQQLTPETLASLREESTPKPDETA